MIAIAGWRYRICLDLDGVATEYAFGDVGIQAGRPSLVPEEKFEAKCSGRCTWLQWRCQEACCSILCSFLFIIFQEVFVKNFQELFLLPRDRPRPLILLGRDWKWCNWCPIMSPLLLISGDYHDLRDRLLHKHHGQILSMFPFSEQGFLQHNATNLCMEQNKAYLASTCDSTVTDGNIVANGAFDLGLCRERKEVERRMRKKQQQMW